jgi:dethiobiotin synthetase
LRSAGTPPGLFVTGTDTGVGKTIATGVLAVCLRAHGLNAGVMKPIETGIGAGVLPDADWLMSVAPSAVPLEMIAPYRLRAPAAPLIAAEAEDLLIDVQRIVSAYEALAARHDCMLIEGVGGVMVPLAPDLLVIDLIHQLRLPVLIVARSGLGSINHTLLTVECLKRRDIPIVGILFNNPTAPPGNADGHETIRMVLQWTGLRLIGELPYGHGLPQTWDRERSRLIAHIDIQALLESVGFRTMA